MYPRWLKKTDLPKHVSCFSFFWMQLIAVLTILCIKRCESVPHAPRHHPGFDPLHFVKSSWPTIDQFLTHIWPVFKQYFIKILPIYVVFHAPMFNFHTLNLTSIWPIFDQHLTHIWPVFDPYLFLISSLLHLDLNLLNLFDPPHFLLKLFSFYFFPSVWFWFGFWLFSISVWFCKELGWSALYVCWSVVTRQIQDLKLQSTTWLLGH